MLPILAAVLAFITIGSLGWVFVGGDDSSGEAVKRAQSFGAPKVTNARKAATAVNTPEARRKQIMTQLQEVERKERKARMTMAAKLKHAGLALSIRTFWMVSGGLGISALLLVLLFTSNLLLALGAGIVLGLGLPRWMVGFLGKRRMKKFSPNLPTPSTSSCAVSSRACRFTTVSRSSVARAPPRWVRNSSIWSRAWASA